MVRFHAALLWVTILGGGVTEVAARIVHQVRYINTTIISVASVDYSAASSPPDSVLASSSSSSSSSSLPPAVGDYTSQSARPAPTVYTSIVSTSVPAQYVTSIPVNLTSVYYPTDGGPSVTTDAINPENTTVPNRDTDPEVSVVTGPIPPETDCLTLSFGEPVTVYEFADNTTTVTLPIGSNATSTPEFTPTPYCCTEDCNTLNTIIETATSSTTLLPFLSSIGETTTVIITSKNARTVFTAEDTPDYGNGGTPGRTQKQTAGADRTANGILPTFPGAKPFATTSSPTPPTPTGGGGGGSSGDSPVESDRPDGSFGGSSDGQSTGGSSNGGAGGPASGNSPGGDGSSGGSSSGGSSGGSSGNSPSGGSSGGNTPGGSSSGGSSNGGSSGGGASSDGSSGENSSSGSSSGASSSGGTSNEGSPSGSENGSAGGGSTGASSNSEQHGSGSGSGTTSVNIGGVPVILSPTNVIINGETYAPNASPTTVVFDHQTFTVNPSQVIAPGTILDVPSQQSAIAVPSPTLSVIGGVTISLGGSVAWIAGTSYTFGQGAIPTTIVTKGKTISIGSAGLGFAKTTVQPPSAQPTAVLILGGDVYSAIGSSVAVIDGQSITYGSGIDQMTTVFNGEALTIGPDGITQSRTTLGGPSRPTGTQIGIAGGLAVTEIGASIIVIQSTTFTIGPGADTITAVINGETIIADPNDIDIGTITTISYPLNPTSRAVTAGGITLTEVGSSRVVIGGSTYTVGNGAPTTTRTINGETISIGPGGVGFSTTTVVPASATGKKNGTDQKPLAQSQVLPKSISPIYMQSEFTESSTRAVDTTHVSESSPTIQHGFLPDQLPSAGSPSSPNEEQGDSAAADVRGASGDAVEELSRLNLGEDMSNRPKPSFQRIAEYENALSPSPPRKQSEGPGFKVVKRKTNSVDGPQLDTFPNEVLTHILSHLPAASLSAVSLVSRRFYNLVTTPHAWRIAFARFFPGQDAIEDASSLHGNRRGSDQEERETLRVEQRLFTRLTGLASWRSEYILRTRLLRSLGRGKPAQIAPGHGASSRSNSAANNANAVVTYSSQLFSTINHIHAVFGNGKKSPRFIHGTDETGTACTSDPNIGKIDNWGLSDPQSLPQFADLFLGDLPYGAGEGPAGLPNTMDVSQPFGLVYGEGFPGGQAYYRSSDEMRGRFLEQIYDFSDLASGIPQIPGLTEAISSVWIAKSTSVPNATDNLIGILCGSTFGIVTAYSLGGDSAQGRRIGKGQVTARWIISPGVPIISIKVDDSYDNTRKAAGRIWAVALNALGEVYYLTEPPSSSSIDAKLDGFVSNKNAWDAGRTTYWHLVEPTRRTARDDPYHEAQIHGSYSPRSSSKAMNLSREQIIAESVEIQRFLKFRPFHFRKWCEGWDMRRKLEIDFGGDDGNGAGEGVFVIGCGFEDNEPAEIKRFTRWNAEQASLEEYPQPKTPLQASQATPYASLFGGGKVDLIAKDPLPFKSPASPMSPNRKTGLSTLVEEWRSSSLSLKDQPNVEITTSAIDMSTHALSTIQEDPLRTVNGTSAISSPFSTPVENSISSTADIPGHRARFLAVGTKTGEIIMWNMRGPQSTNSVLVNELRPLRTVRTESPQISCLALSALYLVHGGNDGLVQAWDPLASTLQPVRTLNSRFSSRARRRLVQAEASIYGVGINLYAAGAIAIDPDPTVLRGMVSLGTHLRYWSYSSSAADQYNSKKRKLRRSSERGHNSGPDRFTNTGRGALMDYIATEQEELQAEKTRRAREEARLAGRFGVGLGGLTEDEALRYAEMVSAEAFQKDEERRISDAGYFADSPPGDSSSAQGDWRSETITPNDSITSCTVSPRKDTKTDDELNHDIEEAIRLSLLDGLNDDNRSPRASGSGGYDIPFTYKQKKSTRSTSSSPSTSKASQRRTKAKGSSSQATSKGLEGIAADDLDFALQLSLAEEQSRIESAGAQNNTPPSSGFQGDEFPSLEVKGKGKGRAN
ncbi:f-box and wd domain protein [Phlyctema vagabunda]|uniref:F-box and wd domain protein n=1 Tax=Phlyctema vagabunda TaxID=108571 RepID=A0ABR4PVF1_9HELO